jgi:predicted XRE-type DNA-binding protein
MRKRKSPSLSAYLAARIKLLAMDKSLCQHEIAAKLGVNQGRVSEVLTGKKFKEVAPASLP